MTLESVSEVIWKFFSQGRPSATAQKLSKPDMMQFAKFTFGSLLRKKFYEEGGTDFYAGSLDIKEYELSDATYQGLRSAVVKDEVLRLPQNADVTNIYPVGTCTGNEMGEITQVSPGEETFYLGPDFNSYQFFVQKGKNINTYHVPPCVKKIAVERIYINENTDVTNDVAFEIALQVLQVSLKVKEFEPTTDNSFDANKNQLRYTLEQAGAKK